MQKLMATLISTLLFVATIANAGVEMELVTTDASGQETERSKIYAQDGKLRMDQAEGSGPANSMIFLGDRFVYVDHAEKNYVVIDEAMLSEVSAQMNEAMKQMEAQLAEMPPEQRAMVEEMMKGQMQGMMGQQAPQPAPKVEAIGSGKWESYDCRQYAVYEGGKKAQDLCAADLDDVEGSDELIETFRAMAHYMEKMMESMPMREDNAINPGELMDQIDGFPVHTVEYEGGVRVRETALASIAESDLDEAMFAAPTGYRRQDPLGGR